MKAVISETKYEAVGEANVFEVKNFQKNTNNSKKKEAFSRKERQEGKMDDK